LGTLSGRPVLSVTLDDLKSSDEGYQYWCEVSVTAQQSGYAGSSAGAPSRGKAAGAAARADKPKATPKSVAGSKVTKPGLANSDNEKKARTILANYQLAINAMSRVTAAAAEKPTDWQWADGDRKQFVTEDACLQSVWQATKMMSFVQDLRAAVFSPQAVKAFKRKYDESYGSLLLRFVVESEPKVSSLQSIVVQVEDTAQVRGIPGYVSDTPKKQSKKPKSQVSPRESSPDPEGRSAKRGRATE
jgi:hypothetical protein